MLWLIITLLLLLVAFLLLRASLREQKSFAGIDGMSRYAVVKLDNNDAVVEAFDLNADEYATVNARACKMSIGDIRHTVDSLVKHDGDQDRLMPWLAVLATRIDEADNVDDQFRCIAAYSNIGYCLLAKGKTETAYRVLLEGLRLSHEFDLPVTVEDALSTNIAKVYELFHDYGRAMDWYRRAIEVELADSLYDGVPYAFTEMAQCAWMADSLDRMSSQISMMKEHKGRGAPMEGYARLIALSSDRYIRGDYNGSVSMADSALTVLDPEFDQERYMAANRLMAAKGAIMARDRVRARNYLDTAENIVNSQRLDDLVDPLYKLKISYHRLCGDSQQATLSELDRLRYSDSVYSAGNYGMIHEAENAWQTTEFSDKLTATRDTSRRVLALNGALWILALVVVVLMVWLIRQNRLLKRRNESLYRKTVESLGQTKPVPPTEADVDTTAEDSSPAEPDNAPKDDKACNNELRMAFDTIVRYMEGSRGIYNPDFNIHTLADAVGITSSRISQAINNVGGKNFNAFLGEYRIKEACRIMLEMVPKHQRPTMEVVAEKVGYKSRPHFLSVFKQVTGLTTTEFMRQSVRNL